MRVWLVDDRKGDGADGLESLLRHLEGRGSGLRLLGVSPFQPDFAMAVRKLVPDLLDLLVVRERSWPDETWTQEILELGLGVVLVTEPDRAGRFLDQANVYPIWFVPPNPDGDALWLALQGAAAARRRQAHWQAQVGRLQQRLNDRVVIERAKGILVEKLAITEDDAYKRLRVMSRRQRRQIRDIAQSLVDTQLLLLPEFDQPARPAHARTENGSANGPVLLPKST